MEEPASFDDVLKLIGTHGKWQWMVFFLTSMSGFFVSFHNMGAVFLAATPEHWCRAPEMTEIGERYNWSEAETRSAFIPTHVQKDKVVHSSCEYFVLNVSAFDDADWRRPEIIANYTRSHAAHLAVRECDAWTYDKSAYTSTVISEWDLVCPRMALSSTVQGSFMGGVLLGCIFYGWVSDKYGRRKAVLIALVQFLASSIIASFSTHYIMFLVFRFFCAIGDAGIFSVAFVIVTEISGRKSRALMGLQYMVPFSVGFMVLPGIAYYIRDWFSLQLAISIPCLLLLSYFWLLPESPRWLVSKGRMRDAIKVLKYGAKMNGNTIPSDEELIFMLQAAQRKEDTFKMEDENAAKSGNFLDLVRTPIVRRRSLVVGLGWFVAGMVYYGLSFSAPYLGTSIYLYIFLAALVEVPAFAADYFLISCIGRRIIYISTMLVSGACCLIILALPKDVVWAITLFALLGKFFSTANFGLVFLYTVELFPTPIRNLSVGTGAMLSRLGSVVAPYIIDLLRVYHEAIPMAIFGSLCVISGLLALYLPETKSGNLPESIEEIENTKTRQLPQNGTKATMVQEEIQIA